MIQSSMIQPSKDFAQMHDFQKNMNINLKTSPIQSFRRYSYSLRMIKKITRDCLLLCRNQIDNFIYFIRVNKMKPQSIRELNGLKENPQLVNRNQLNTSSSKMQYSFPQAERFQNNKKMSMSPPKFYDLPDLWGPKKRSLGYGKRTDLSKQNTTTPSPGQYRLKSQFEKHENQGITMHSGRDDIKSNNLFAMNQTKSPNPTSYHPIVYQNTRAFSMGKKLHVPENKWLKNVPGPGNYSFMELTNQRSLKMVSKYKSAQSSKIGTSLRPSLAKKSTSPGPGQHEIKSESFDKSLQKKAYAPKFGQGKRHQLAKKNNTPGPGSYNVFSEFLH